MSTPDKPADAAKPTPPKHTGGKFRKGVSGNPGGRRKVFTPPQAPQPAPQASSTQGSQPEVEQPINPGRKKDGTFAKGFVANPNGKPKGARHRATLMAEAMLDGQAEALIQQAISMALAGDAQALRICVERIIPARKDRPVEVALPKISAASDLIAATAALTAAAANGEITPSEASDLVRLVEGAARAIEVHDLAARIEKLEELTAGKSANQ
jgi:Family of unknown function (DUF5681)